MIEGTFATAHMYGRFDVMKTHKKSVLYHQAGEILEQEYFRLISPFENTHPSRWPLKLA